MDLAAAAQRLVPDLAPPAAHYARLLLDQQRGGQAARVVERAWRTAPHPELAQVYGAVHAGDAPLARYKRFERLAGQNADARESHIALAAAAFDAQLWGEARRHLEQALAAAAPPLVIAKGSNSAATHSPSAGAGRDGSLTGPTPRLCLLMARLEEAEHGPGEAMRSWLDRAVSAMPDPRYICTGCGGESLEWESCCPHCGRFDTLLWRTPAWVAGGAPLPALAQDAPSPVRELAAVEPADD